MKVLSIIALALMITSPSFASDHKEEHKDAAAHADTTHATTEMPADANKPMPKANKKVKVKKDAVKADAAPAADAVKAETSPAAKSGH